MISISPLKSWVLMDSRQDARVLAELYVGVMMEIEGLWLFEI